MKVLFVCLGNICRSPTAEGVVRALAARTAANHRLKVDSAGTAGYHIGAQADPRSRAAALRRGLDISDLRARKVTRNDFAEFDLILAMDRDNLRDLEARRPDSAHAKLGLFLQYAPETGLLDVPDPYYGGEEDFELVLDLCSAGARGLLATLGCG